MSDDTEQDEISGNFTDSATREDKLNHYHDRAKEQYYRENFIQFLLSTPEVCKVHELNTSAVDFYVGDIDAYPDSFNNDHLDVVGRSSISYRQHGVERRDKELYVTEANIHFPPTKKMFREEIADILSFESDDVTVRFGSQGIRTITPEGIITPHVIARNVTFDTAEEIVRKAVIVYREVYGHGKNAVKERPE
jgi:hypothetical protein